MVVNNGETMVNDEFARSIPPVKIWRNCDKLMVDVFFYAGDSWSRR